MRRLFALGLLIASASMSMGCATCCNPYDYAYGYHGGAWQRDNLCDGRVGSVFAPAGSQVYANKQQAEKTESTEPETLPPETKPPADLKPDDLSTSQPLKSVKRTRKAAPARPYLPVND
ncbi:MAG: hypothetical protein ACR2FY_21445 [Pirellulaceae bacterium]